MDFATRRMAPAHAVSSTTGPRRFRRRLFGMGDFGGLADVGSVCFQTFKSLCSSVQATSRGGTGGVRKDG